MRGRAVLRRGEPRGERPIAGVGARTAVQRDRPGADGAHRDPGGHRMARRAQWSRAARRALRRRRARARHRPRIVHPVRALGRAPPPLWLGATPQRAAETIVLRTAGEGWRVGTSCPVRQWRHGWVGYAELGAIAWHAVPDLNAPVDADTWTAMEHSLREGYLEAECAHPALAATSALVRWCAGALVRWCARCSCRRAGTTSRAPPTTARCARSKSPPACGGRCVTRDPVRNRPHRPI